MIKKQEAQYLFTYEAGVTDNETSSYIIFLSKTLHNKIILHAEEKKEKKSKFFLV